MVLASVIAPLAQRQWEVYIIGTSTSPSKVPNFGEKNGKYKVWIEQDTLPSLLAEAAAEHGCKKNYRQPASAASRLTFGVETPDRRRRKRLRARLRDVGFHSLVFSVGVSRARLIGRQLLKDGADPLSYGLLHRLEVLVVFPEREPLRRD